MKRLMCMVMLLMAVNFVAATDYFSDRINFFESQNHTQEITGILGNNVTVTIPSNFIVNYYSPGGLLVGNQITWANATGTVSYTIQSPNNVTEGEVIESRIYIDGVYLDSFKFISIPDEKIVNYKAELGHGESNWLDTNWLPSGNSSLFGVIRMFPLGSYFNEDALNGSITCVFPKYHVVVSQGNDGSTFEHNPTNVTANFYWENLWRNWFRVGPLAQDILNAEEGENYTVTCGQASYYYQHGKVVADFEPVVFMFADSDALQINVTKGTNLFIPEPQNNTPDLYVNTETLGNGEYAFTITNTKGYTVHDLEFKWKLSNGYTSTQYLRELRGGEAVVYYVGLDGSGQLMLEASYVHDWYKNSLQDHYYTQQKMITFNINSNPLRITSDALFRTLLRGNKVEMSDFPSIMAGEEYRAKIMTYDFFGAPIDADALPKVTLIDPTGMVVAANIEMEKLDTGFYEYIFTTDGSDMNGVWETVIKVPMSGEEVTKQDYWQIGGNPAQVKIEAMDTTISSLVCWMTIENEGEAPQEYQYKYWLTNVEYGQYGDQDMKDGGSAAKLLEPGESWTVALPFTENTPGVYWCKALVYYGAQYSAASDKFTAVVNLGAKSPVETCYDGKDNDNDGLVDAADTDCLTYKTEGKPTFFIGNSTAPKASPFILLLIIGIIGYFIYRGKKQEQYQRRRY